MEPRNRRPSIALLVLALLAIPAAASARERAQARPNILFILVDNLGYGELGVYGGGATRGAPTPRLDRLAAEGMRLTNMNMEPQCTPSRSGIMTGRFAIRSGTYAVPLGGVAEGLTRRETTVAESLSAVGYATGYFGKWHLGSTDGRLPTDQGFQEWYGIPRTSDEALWPEHSQYTPDIVKPESVLEGRHGQHSHGVVTYDLEERRLIDAELTRRSIDFMERQVKAKKPFFVFTSLTQPHLPSLPNPAFVGKTGNGDWADMLAELDFNAGQLLDAVDRLGVRGDTIVVFTSDNGAEFLEPWAGWPGPWRGAYNTALEGGLRVPFLIRWPGHVPAGRVSNEIVHGVDMFPTLARLTGARVPRDRIIDGVDQSAFFLGRADKSARESFPIWNQDILMAVKWRNWKVHFYRQDNMLEPPLELLVPHIINLYTDPREETPTVDTWVLSPVLEVVAAFEKSVKKEPLIPMGTPDR
ncbi:arylsulfatase [Vulgatibacter sp.]|uniref:arylsulfatase n=1 Tax=Vulgatibacter sp. TaxID=1971226 RepID=UPI003569CB78